MKNFKKVLALVLVVAMMMSFVVVASAKAYTDEKDISNKEAVDVLSYIGVLGGYPAGDFKPTNEITRAEAAKIIAIFKNGSTDISDLYKTANTFADVKGNWAESYVAYCAKAGIVSGRNENTFDPSANVTGVEFLKMALVVLGLDADAEGYKGTAWQVNILEDAKQIGLLAGLGKNWNPAAAITREEAAQVMLNALQAYKYDYGYATKLGLDAAKIEDAIKNYGIYGPEKAAQMIIESLGIWVTKAGAVATKNQLMADWNLKVTDGHDAWGRPVKSWQDTKGTIIPTDDVEVLTTKIAPVATFNVATKNCDILKALDLKKATATVTDYVNGTDTGAYTIADNATTKGAQGRQLEFYKTDAGIELVEIATYLAKITKVTAEKLDANGHVVNDAYLTLDVYKAATEVCYVKGNDYAKGDYVLVNVNDNTANNVTIKNIGSQKLVEVVGEADTVVAKMTGFNTAKRASTFDTAAYSWAEKFFLGYYGAIGTKYNVFFDQFGNEIGLTVYKDADVYAILDRGIQVTAGFDTYFAAKMANLEGVVTEEKVAKVDGAAPAWNDLGATQEHKLVKKEGLELTTIGTKITAGNILKAYPRVLDYALAPVAVTDAATLYIVETAGHVFSTYTGYEAMPTVKNADITYFDEDADGYMDIVYVDATVAGAVFTGESQFAYIMTAVADAGDATVGSKTVDVVENIAINGAVKDDVLVDQGFTATLLTYAGCAVDLIYNADGVVVDAVPYTTFVAGTVAADNSNEVVYIGSALMGYVVNDESVVWVVDNTNVTCAAGTADDFVTGTSLAYVTAADGKTIEIAILFK